jgi:geranylgeranyl pyrophosphate synthase
LPLILAVEAGGGKAAGQLLELLAPDQISEESVRRVRELVETEGAVELAWARVREWLGAARDELEPAPQGEARMALMSACGERFPMPVMAGEK